MGYFTEGFDVLDNVPLGVFILNSDYTVLFWNKCIEEWTNISASGITGSKIFDFYPHLKEPGYKSRIDSVFESGAPTIFSSQLHKHFVPSVMWNGELRIQHTIVKALETKGGDCLAFFTIQDVTDLTERLHDYRLMRDKAFNEIKERERVEEELKLNEARLEALLELNSLNYKSLREIADFSLDKCVVLTGSHIGFLGFMTKDESEFTIHAWSKDVMKECAVIDKPIHYSIKDAGLWGDAVRQRKTIVVNDYDDRVYEKRGIPEGHVNLTRLLVIPVMSKGKIVSVGAVGNKESDYNNSDLRQMRLLLDGMWRMIERKGAEDELSRKTGELEKLNFTLELKVREEVEKRRQKEQMLIQQSKMAAMGEMIGAIAHQWRQPLTAIALLVQDIQDAREHNELDDDYLNRIVIKAMSQIDFMSKTIDNFRNFFKASKGKNEFDIAGSINEVIKLISGQLNNCNISVEIKNNLETPVLMNSYSNEFMQVVLNLVNNAKDAIIEAIEQGILDKYDGLISIVISSVNRTVTIGISDNGIGIPAEIENRIFEPYFSTKEEGRGTGIGLYMSKVIIETNMGGKLYSHNVVGGAGFMIELSL